MGESRQQQRQDIALAVAYTLLALLAARKLCLNFHTDGSGKVLTVFYALIFLAPLLRAVWFFIPNSVLEPSYTPVPTHAFQDRWVGVFVSEVLASLGSLALYSVFILFVTVWSSMLRKIYRESMRPAKPMRTFGIVMGALVLVQATNYTLFLTNIYNSQGMILFDSILLTVVSLVTLIEISIFSRKFRTVLRAFGSINQYSTEQQTRRIKWTTITTNLFFLIRVSLEAALAATLIYLWHKNRAFGALLDDHYWNLYILIKHGSELAIIALILAIAQLNPSNRQQVDRGDYTPV